MSPSVSLRQPAARVFTTALLAAMFLLQVCAGFASPLPENGFASTPVSDRGCCGTDSGQVCGDLNSSEVADSCARHCVQPGHPAPSQVFVSGSDVSIFSPGVYTGKAVFPAQAPTLRAAPRAISSTPLIYHLQRLLN